MKSDSVISDQIWHIVGLKKILQATPSHKDCIRTMKTLCKQIEMLRKDDFSLYNHLIVKQHPSPLALKESASGN